MVDGSLDGKRIYLDANALIYVFEDPDSVPNLVLLLATATQRGIRLVSSVITLSEVLVHPIKSGNSALESAYRRFFVPSHTLTLRAVDEIIASEAARLRSAHPLRTPDAIHIATGLQANCDVFLTQDLAWSKVGIQVVTPF
ncbi:MAG: type II toxin-antitoxin system VapC family toxin [Fimbriimonas sp.]